MTEFQIGDPVRVIGANPYIDVRWQPYLDEFIGKSSWVKNKKRVYGEHIYEIEGIWYWLAEGWLEKIDITADLTSSEYEDLESSWDLL